MRSYPARNTSIDRLRFSLLVLQRPVAYRAGAWRRKLVRYRREELRVVDYDGDGGGAFLLVDRVFGDGTDLRGGRCVGVGVHLEDLAESV